MAKYSDLVDYSSLDPFKKKALDTFTETFKNPEQRLGVKIMPGGETSAVIDFLDYDFMLAFNVEGLGTKNIIADKVYERLKIDGRTQDAARYYRWIGQDSAAMSLTDLVAVGADPIVYGDILGSGDSSWFNEEKNPGRLGAFLAGFRDAADQAGCAIPQGETPGLPGVVHGFTLDLSGASVGIIKPKSRLTFGDKVREGDAIYALPSNGLCSNGISKARAIAESLPNGYFTELDNGKELAEELLIPTPIYVRHIIEMFEAGVDIHYITPITGHGWKKFARCRNPFTYTFDSVPEVPHVISELIRLGKQSGFDMSDRENYQVWNMGAFMGIIAPSDDEETMRKVAEKRGTELLRLGTVERGEKEVVIKPLNIVY